ncbi:hypothetical protein [Nocardioides pacificus]
MSVPEMSAMQRDQLRMTWVEVRDHRGRTHLEAHWVSASTPAAPAAAA